MADPRTSLNLPAALVKQAKRLAIDEGCTLSELVADALRARLASTPLGDTDQRGVDDAKATTASNSK